MEKRKTPLFGEELPVPHNRLSPLSTSVLGPFNASTASVVLSVRMASPEHLLNFAPFRRREAGEAHRVFRLEAIGERSKKLRTYITSSFAAWRSHPFGAPQSERCAQHTGDCGRLAAGFACALRQ